MRGILSLSFTLFAHSVNDAYAAVNPQQVVGHAVACFGLGGTIGWNWRVTATVSCSLKVIKTMIGPRKVQESVGVVPDGIR